MKKFNCLLSVILPVALLVGISDANAQSKNDTKKDVNVESTMPTADKHMKKSASHLERKMADIEEDYNEALNKLNKSSFDEAQKKMLNDQLQENKEFAIKTAREKNGLTMKHWKLRQSMRQELKKDKSKRKVIKEIDDID